MERLHPAEKLVDNFNEMHWTPPFGTLKSNIDAAWSSGDAALAILAREEDCVDSKGLWLSRMT